MDYGLWNGVGITLLAAFGLWAFFKGHKLIEKMLEKPLKNAKDKK